MIPSKLHAPYHGRDEVVKKLTSATGKPEYLALFSGYYCAERDSEGVWKYGRGTYLGDDDD